MRLFISTPIQAENLPWACSILSTDALDRLLFESIRLQPGAESTIAPSIHCLLYNRLVWGKSAQTQSCITASCVRSGEVTIPVIYLPDLRCLLDVPPADNCCWVIKAFYCTPATFAAPINAYATISISVGSAFSAFCVSASLLCMVSNLHQWLSLWITLSIPRFSLFWSFGSISSWLTAEQIY